MAVSKIPSTVKLIEDSFTFPAVSKFVDDTIMLSSPNRVIKNNTGKMLNDAEIDAITSSPAPTVVKKYIDRAADTAFEKDFQKKDSAGVALNAQPGGAIETEIPVTIKAPLNATPPAPAVVSTAASSTTAQIKPATPDIITIDQETLPAELMTALIFESIGGQELLSLSRHDLITGGNLEYQPIRNMAIINAEYNSSNIIFMPDSATAYLRNFPISWDSHIIESFSDLDSSHIKIDTTKNELVIIVTDMKPGEQVEVETLKSVTSYDYTKF